MNTTRSRSSGFTLVEALVVIAIAGMVAAIGVPQLNSYTQNQKTKAAAGNLAAAIQSARLEALKQNKKVQIVFTSAAPIAANATSAAKVRTGPNWIIRSIDTVPNIDPTAVTTSYGFIDGYDGTNVGRTSGGLPVVTFNASAGAGALTHIEFSPLSRATFNAEDGGSAATTATIDFANVLGGACQTSNTDTTHTMRCLRVVVTLGGQAKVCDPLVTDVKDTRKCT